MSKRALRRIGKQMEVGLLVFSMLFMQVAPGLQATVMAVEQGEAEQNTETIAQWDFTASNSKSLDVTTGAGNLSVEGVDLTSDSDWRDSNNVPNPNGWNADNAWKISDLNFSDYQNIQLTAEQRSTSTGPRDFVLEYDNNGEWTEIGTSQSIESDGSWETLFDNEGLPQNVEGQNNVDLRIRVDENTAVNEDDIDGGGRSAIRNITITGESYPVMIGDQGYASISKALNNVGEGDTITVDGDYTEAGDLEVKTQNVTLKSSGDPQSTINGNVKVSADGVTVDGFDINESSGSPLDIQAGDITITNNTVKGGDNAGGISPWTGTGPITGTVDISNNTVNNGPIGLYLNGQADITINNNIINDGAGEGIWLAKDFSANSPDVSDVAVSITGNDISNVAKKDIKISADIDVNGKTAYTEIAKAVLGNNTANSILLADGQVYDSDGRVVVEEKKDFTEEEKGSVQVAKGVKVSAVDGSDINLEDLTISDVSQVTKGSGEDEVKSLQAVKFGPDGRNLTFSKPVSITLNVSGVDGQTLDVYRKPEGENENFEELTTCTVDDGQCSFKTTKASTFAVFPDTGAPKVIEGLKITQDGEDGREDVGDFLNEEEQKEDVRIEWDDNETAEYDENFKEFEYKNAQGTVKILTNSFFEGRIGGSNPEEGKTYTYQVRAVDQAGNKGDWNEVSVTLDFTKPEVSIDSPSDEEVVNDEFAVEGQITDETSDIVDPEIRINKIDELGGSFKDSIVGNDLNLDENGDYSYDISDLELNTGFYRIQVRGYDKAGNRRIKTIDVHVDLEKPNGGITNLSDGDYITSFDVKGESEGVISSVDRVLITATEFESAKFENRLGQRISQKEAELDTDTGEFSFSDEDLADGHYRVQARIIDTVENIRYSTKDVTLDSTDPEAEITEPSKDDAVSGTVDIVGKVTDENPMNTYFEIQDSKGNKITSDVKKDGSEEHTFTWNTSDEQVDDGKYTVYFAARDKAGNRDPENLDPEAGDSVDSVTVVVDNTAPGLEIDKVGPTISQSTEIRIKLFQHGGTIIQKINVWIENNEGEEVQGTREVIEVNEENSYVYTIDTGYLQNGRMYTVHAEVVDRAGNTAENSRIFNVDTQDPDVEIREPQDQVYTISSEEDIIPVDGEVFDGTLDKVQYKLLDKDDKVLKSGELEVNKGKAFLTAEDIEFEWTDGTYTIRLRARDLGGNTNSDEVTFIVSIETQQDPIEDSKNDGEQNTDNGEQDSEQSYDSTEGSTEEDSTENDTTSQEQDSEQTDETGDDKNTEQKSNGGDEAANDEQDSGQSGDTTEESTDMTEDEAQEDSSQNIINLQNNNGDTAKGEEDTQVTNEQGEEVDVSDLIFETVEKEEKDGQEAVSSVKFGVEGDNLTFSNPVTITLNVGSEFDGETLDVFRRPEGANAELTQDGLIDTTCEVSEGQCSFQTTKASTFSVFAQVTEETEEVDETAPQVDFMVPEDEATYTLMVPMNEQGMMGESILMNENGEEVSTKIEITDDNLTSYGYTLENRIPEIDDEYLQVAAKEMTVEGDMATITEFEIAEGMPFEWGIGEYRLTVTAEDEQGNTTEEVITFQVEFAEEMMNQIPEGGFMLDEERLNQLVADFLADEEIQALLQQELQGFIQEFLADLQESDFVLDTDQDGNLVLTLDGQKLLTITPNALMFILEELDLESNDIPDGIGGPIDMIPDGVPGLPQEEQLPEGDRGDREDISQIPEQEEDLGPIDLDNLPSQQPQDESGQDDFAGGGGIPQDDFVQEPSTPTSGIDGDIAEDNDSDEDTTDNEEQEEDTNGDEQEEDSEEDIDLDDELSDIEEEQDEEENNGLGATIGNFIGTFFSSWWGWVITLVVIFGLIGGVIKKNASV